MDDLSTSKPDGNPPQPNGPSVAGPSTSLVTVILSPQNLTLHVPIHAGATIADLKTSIFIQCPGKPLQSGQRIVCNGRFLNDAEVVGDVVKNDHGQPTVYLSVNPTSWSDPKPAQAPSLPTAPATAQGGGSTSRRRSSSSRPPSYDDFFALPSKTSTHAIIPATSLPPLMPVTSTVNIPQQWIIHQHTNAVRILADQHPVQWLGPGDFKSAETTTMMILLAEMIGFPQDSPLNEDLFVLASENTMLEGGATYAWTIVDNLPYLSLVTPSTPPNKLQQAAIEVLTYTFPLLPVLPNLPASFALTSTTRRSHPDTTPQIRVINFGANNRAGRYLGAQQQNGFGWNYVQITNSLLRSVLNIIAHPTRLLIPIGLIIFRAAFVVYIFGWTPERAPGWFCAVLLWMTWEIWAIIRVEGARVQGERARVVRRVAAAAAAAAAGGNVGGAGAGGPGNNGGLAAAAAGDAPFAFDDGQNAAQAGADGLRNRRQPNGNAMANENVDENAGLGERRPRMAFPHEHAAAAAGGQSPQLFRLIRWLASYRLDTERQQLGLDATPTPTPTTAALPDSSQPRVQGQAAVPPHVLHEPTRMERITTFLFLLVCTLSPEVWARRLQDLRVREGEVRMMYGREWQEDQPLQEGGEGQQLDERERVTAERRRALTGWRRAYVRRVLGGGVGDDVDL
ncbi:hypothetical protein FRB98_003485 [Tulasnella sp. 332]|nr:hypothetical protein FRB98_003485 [Tulasnella sp. 332]